MPNGRISVAEAVMHRAAKFRRFRSDQQLTESLAHFRVARKEEFSDRSHTSSQELGRFGANAVYHLEQDAPPAGVSTVWLCRVLRDLKGHPTSTICSGLIHKDGQYLFSALNVPPIVERPQKGWSKKEKSSLT